MPLKHATETRLVILLGAAMAAAGIVTILLPSLPAGTLPWCVAFIVALLYPLFLYPLFRSNRADYTFRMLHWVPAGVLMLWMVIEILAKMFESLAYLWEWLAWATVILAVAVGFILLIAFCLNVIRRRVPRVTVLMLLFIVYGVFAFQGGSQEISVQQIVASVTQSAESMISKVVRSVKKDDAMEKDSMTSEEPKLIGSVITKEDEELEPSEDAAMPSWSGLFGSKKAEKMEKKDDEAMKKEEVMKKEDPLPVELRPGGSGAHMREVATTPSKLPHSGFGWSTIILLMIALYCGAVHDRTRRRV